MSETETKKEIPEIRVEDDRIKNLLLGILIVVLFFVLWILAALTYNIKQYLICFFILTGMFYCIKWGYIYLARAVSNTPLFTFRPDGIRIPHYFKKDEIIPYSTINRIDILDDDKGYSDILIHSSEVKHPSGYYHFGLKYPFKKNELSNNRSVVIRETRNRGIHVNEQKKKKD